MNNKIVVFSYKRDSLPHSEYQVRKQLEKFLVDDSSSFVITTSTASIFDVVFCLCEDTDARLAANYEGKPIEIERTEDYCRIKNLSNFPDIETTYNERFF